MKKYLWMLLGVLIVNGLSAAENGAENKTVQKPKLVVIRAKKPASNGISEKSSSDKDCLSNPFPPFQEQCAITLMSNGKIEEGVEFLAKAIIKERSKDRFRLPNPLLPLQEE